MSRTLRVGCRGVDVAAVQDALNQIGANTVLPDQRTILALLVPDGVFGNKTYSRVKDFQQLNALAADGVVGPVTLARLQELLPAVQDGMSTSRPAGLVNDPAPSGGSKSLPPYPAIHPNPFSTGGIKSTDSGSKTSSLGSPSSSSGSKTSKW
jgi:peptidoglycan hydrolase-like protein with peptidoglycan-binding domain